MSILDSFELEQVIALVATFVIVKLSSIKTGEFNLPHLFLNDLILMFPSVACLEGMNDKAKGKRVKKSQKNAPVVRKFKTVGDRVNAMEFEIERVQQGQMLQFAGWDIFDNMILFCFISIVGFCLIEGWRWMYMMRKLGDCGTQSQLSLHEDAALRRTKYEPFTYIIFASLGYASNCPHQAMYSKMKSFALSSVFVFFFFLFIHTPALEEMFGLPVSRVAEDIAIRTALFLRLVGTTDPDGDWIVDGTLTVCVKCAIAFNLWFACAGFAHSLQQFARVSSFILKKKQASLTPLKVVIGIVAFVPMLILLTYMLREQLEALPGMKHHGLSAIHVRIILGMTWSFLYFAMVPKHLQFYLQQAVQDCTKDLRLHTVDPEKVRTHFYQRSTLLVYSACQLTCFGVYMIVLVLLAANKSALGGLGHARPYTFGSFASGPFQPAVVSRSAAYDVGQKIFVGEKSFFKRLRSCDPILDGGYGVAGEWEGEWPVTSWEENAKAIDISLSDIWSDENMKKIVDEEGGWARVIAYHDVNFEENNLINSKDKAKAKQLKKSVLKVRGILFAMTFHTFISPPNWTVLADAFGGIMCVLWVVVYVRCMIGFVRGGAFNSKDEVDMSFDFEISEKKKEQ
ncbi:hypothetical protein TrST_g1269 [Triparma strigata]|uniref:Uncharacterized protein n=1 Tax=Triparma strigata TaxID=1606541 RepID=A0A9W6ZJQ3_9STRA|nr:hypothetical protein TrST_g1269 [Triparma strigata]